MFKLVSKFSVVDSLVLSRILFTPLAQLDSLVLSASVVFGTKMVSGTRMHALRLLEKVFNCGKICTQKPKEGPKMQNMIVASIMAATKTEESVMVVTLLVCYFLVVIHGCRNRSGRPCGCQANNLTNNFYVHIILTVEHEMDPDRSFSLTIVIFCNLLFMLLSDRSLLGGGGLP